MTITPTEEILIMTLTFITCLILISILVLIIADTLLQQWHRREYIREQTNPDVIKALNEYEHMKGLMFKGKKK